MSSLLLTLSVFGLSSLAFYFSLNAYVNDAQHRKQLDAKYRAYASVLNHTLVAQKAQNDILNKKAQLDGLITTCGNERTLIAMASLATAQGIADQNHAAEVNCFQQTRDLNRTLQQLTAPTIETTLYSSGGCDFTSDNSTGLTDYAYRRLSYNGVDFYYYQFDTSSDIWTTNGTVTVRNCFPPILNSTNVLKRGYNDGIVPNGGVAYILTGNGQITIVFNTGNKNVRLNYFQVWVEGI